MGRIKTTWPALLFIILLWSALHLLLASPLLPSPWDTVINCVHLFSKGMLWHLASSSWRLLAALVLATGLSLIIGLSLGLGERLDRILTPLLYLLTPLPKIALLPILMILLGVGEVSKIALIVLIIVFPQILAVRDSARTIDSELLTAAASLKLSHKAFLLDVALPAILPALLSALRVSAGIAAAVLFTTENFATEHGLGYFIMNSWAMSHYLNMYSGILLLSLLAYVLFLSVDWLEYRLCPWLSSSSAG